MKNTTTLPNKIENGVKTMDDIHFLMCASKTKRGIDSDIETVFLKGYQSGYEINFYGLAENGYELIVEDFGRNSKKGWEQYEPTTMQLKVMKDLLKREVDTVYRENGEKKAQEKLDMRFKKEMEATHDFINHNFLSY